MITMPILSILMPVYNEVERIRGALHEVIHTELPFDYELIVIDDGSTDGTRAILQEYDWPANARLLLHDRNQGKGAAVRTGLTSARGRFTAIMDADLEYDPADLAPLVEPLLRGDVNACFGVRAFDGYTSHSFLFVMGNKSVTLAANLLYNVYLRDLMTCHKAMDTELFRSLQLREPGFGIEPEIAAKLLRRGERIFEIPVKYKARATEDGKKLTATDGLRVLRTLIRCRFERVPQALPAPQSVSEPERDLAGSSLVA